MTTSSAIALPFSFDVNGRVNSTTDQKKIMQDRVALVLMTYLGERVNRPNFGTKIRGVAFETQGVAESIIENEAARAFTTYLPYLTLINTSFSINEDNLLQVSVTYKYGLSSQPETVTVTTATITNSGDIITEA